MPNISEQLDDALSRLEPDRARYLENLVRDALALAEPPGGSENGAAGWPPGYFDETAGAFAGERLERPPQGELPECDEW